MPQRIEEITNVPAAFEEPFKRLNDTIRAVNALLSAEGRGGIKVLVSDGNVVIEYNPEANGSDGISGASGLPNGYTFEEFTICDSGTPATRWWPTWTSDPS